MNEIELKENDAQVEQEVLTKLTKLYQECMELNENIQEMFLAGLFKSSGFLTRY